jgi:hypothetical protein
MLAAIELDDEPCIAAIEIDHIRRDRMLPAEFPPAEAPIPQQKP